jgi:hypothetical protein
VTYDGEFIRIYLDGSLEDTIFSASPNTAPGNLLFGSSFSGMLDEIYIYDRKLGEVEVQALASLP